MRRHRPIKRRKDRKYDLRSATDAQDMQLGLIQRHVTQRQAGKETRQEHQDRDKACKDNKFGVVRLMVVPTRYRRLVWFVYGEVVTVISTRSKLGDMMDDERG